MDAAGLSFRTHTEEDLPFLHSSWGSSYYDGTQAKKYLNPDEFHAYHRPIRERFFERRTKHITICTPDDDAWHILGWAATEQRANCQILHYLYVKSAFKCQGIAEALLKRACPKGPILFTHLTDRAARIMAKKHSEFEGFIHVPNLV